MMTGQDRLGEICFRCSPRSLIDFSLQQGTPPGLMFLGVFGFLFFAMFFTMPFMLLLDPPKPWMAQPVFWAIYLPWCLLLIWSFYILPSKDFLVVHSNGFRYRFHTLFATTVLFDDLQCIRIGWKSEFSELTKAVARWRIQNFDHMLRQSEKTTLCLKHRNGKETLLKTFLVRFVEQDTIRFLQHVMDHHPKLLMEPPEPSSNL